MPFQRFIFDNTSDLILTVEVTGYRSATEVNVLTYSRVTDICKVSCSSVVVDGRVLDLYVSSDGNVIVDPRLGSYM